MAILVPSAGTTATSSVPAEHEKRGAPFAQASEPWPLETPRRRTLVAVIA